MKFIGTFTKNLSIKLKFH